MSNDPRVDKAMLDLIYLDVRIDQLDKEVRLQAEEIRQLKRCLKIDPNVLRNIVYNKNKGDKKV